MFGSIQNTLIAVGLSLLVGIAIGWRVESKFCQADALKKEVAALNARLQATNEAATNDAFRFAESQKQIDELQQRITDAEKDAGRSQCLGPDDTRRLRSLWK